MKAIHLIYSVLVGAGLMGTPGFAEETALDIFQAIRAGDTAKVAALARERPLMEARDPEGNTPLIVAGLKGTPETVHVLLASGAEVNATNKGGATALIYGSYDFEKAKALIARGADINARSGLGNTPLMLAARVNGNFRTVRLLLERGAEVNTTNVFGANALMCAAASEDSAIMKLLLREGAEVNATLAPGLAGAIWGGGRSPLMWAAHRNDLWAISLLLKHGAALNGMEGFGSALTQAAWAERTEAARLLLKHGANVNQRDPMGDYTPLHWAASTESGKIELVKLLLSHGAEVNAKGGEPVGAFMGTLYTPLMLAQKRGETEVVKELLRAGAKGEIEGTKDVAAPERQLPPELSRELLRGAVAQALPHLEKTAKESRADYANHASKQNCLSCHQQFLPAAALGYARRAGVNGDKALLAELTQWMLTEGGEPPGTGVEPTFHPEPAHSYGLIFMAMGANEVTANAAIDTWVHHLAAIQAPAGNWYNNLPRPPVQTSDVGATALALHALRKYPLPGRKAEFARRVERARKWLWQVEATNTEEWTYQLLGLHWAGESPVRLKKLADGLLRQQRADGGWGQLPKLGSDGYATGQALFALHQAAGIRLSDERFEKGVRYLLRKQLADGTWFAPRRAFPFQPTMKSGFPHGRDGWLAASATSWSTMALAVTLKEMERGLAIQLQTQ